MEKSQTEDRELKEIGQYYGTQAYHQGWLNVNYTDGVKYVTDNGYSWLVSDAISVIRTQPRFKKEEFLVVNLLLHNPPLTKWNSETDSNEEVVATMTIDDGNNNLLYTQSYTFTDAKVPLKLYFADNVMMLPSEY